MEKTHLIKGYTSQIDHRFTDFARPDEFSVMWAERKKEEVWCYCSVFTCDWNCFFSSFLTKAEGNTFEVCLGLVSGSLGLVPEY